VRIISGSKTYGLVSEKFVSSWRIEKGPVPAILAVYEVKSLYIQQEWERYREVLVRRRHNTSTSLFFHGTSLSCDIINSGVLCRNKSCGACGVSCEGMKEEYIGSHTSTERFGKGYYLAPESSKCNDYTDPNGRGQRALLLCEVLPGNMYETDRKIDRPPQGYDSVYVKEGSILNYPELIVYDPRAIFPRYIVVCK